MRRLSIVVSALLMAASVASDDEKSVEPVPLAVLDIASTNNGAFPSGSTPIAGKWSVDAGAKKIKLDPFPLINAVLEFGPEVREKSARAVALARAPGAGRLQSWMGVGLYGKNGFQLRLVHGRGETEFVHRGAVLASAPAEIEQGQLYFMELVVESVESSWKLSGRIWRHEGQRPTEPIIETTFSQSNLLVPLAGRTRITATAFSGEPVAFASARVFLLPEKELAEVE